MATTLIYTVFNKKRRPLICGVDDLESGKTAIVPLYAPCYGLTIHKVVTNIQKLRDVILKRAGNGTLAFPDFQSHLDAFDLPRSHGLNYDVYDLGLPCVDSKTNTNEELTRIVQVGLKRMRETALEPWMKVVASAALVYNDLQERGILINGTRQYPIWLQNTYSGRSKCEVISAQGLDESYDVNNATGAISDEFFHFDWVAADINMLALLSNDPQLLESFESSDPYSYLEQLLGMPREDCKRALLSAINSLDHADPLLSEIFTVTGKWLFKTESEILKNGHIRGVMGRKFSMSEKRTKLAVLNAYLQGGVAMGMKLALKKIWDKFGHALLLEVHDSLTFTCAPSPESSIPLIDGVSEIMTRPFAGIEGLDHAFFPVKISRGSKYKQWQPFQIVRREGLEDVVLQDLPSTSQQTEGNA